MQNKLSDLNNHLFAALERLSDEDLTDKDVAREVSRAKAISAVAKNIIDNANIQLDVIKHIDNQGRSKIDFPEILKISSGD